MKEDNSSLIYVLADYKQQVLQYKTKFWQQAKKALFWKVAAIWCGMIIFCLGLVMYFWVTDAQKAFRDSKISINKLGLRLEQITVKLEESQEELKAAKDELRSNGEAISRLEQGISSTSKRLVENLLKVRY